MAERDYQSRLIKKLKKRYVGCVILKNDPNYIQGFPDICILFGPAWGVLEVKDSEDAPSRPNQEYYVNMLHEMSYSSFICPENEEDVLYELDFALGLRR